MLKTFQNYLEENSRFQNICNTADFRYIYENILLVDDTIIKMIDAAEHKITPVSIPAKEIESYVGSSSIILDRAIDEKVADLNRQAIGTMIFHILNQFGYEKIKDHNRQIPNNYKGEYLSTGATYSKTGIASMRIVKRIEEVTN